MREGDGGRDTGRNIESEREWKHLCCTRLACCMTMNLMVPQVIILGDAAPPPSPLTKSSCPLCSSPAWAPRNDPCL